MPVWLYALTRQALPADAPAGAAGEPLASWPLDAGSGGEAGLFVVAGEVAAALRPSEESLRAHERTVRALAALLDPLLPVRFGQTVAEPALLAPLLVPRCAALLAALAEVEGCVQMTLRLPAPAPAPTGPGAGEAAAPGDPSGPGASYLHARRRAAAAAAAPPPHARPLLDRLAPFVRAERVAAARPPRAAAVYHLVPRDRLDAYLAALAAAGPPLDLPAAASGPWPAWAFAPGLVE